MRHLAHWAARIAARVSALCLVAILAGCAGNVSPEFYKSVTRDLLAKGFLRSDPAAEIPIDATGLSRSFRDVTFSYEFHFKDGEIINEPLEKPLKRWRGVVRYKLIGDAYTQEDVKEIRNLTNRLGDLTGLWFTQTEQAHDLLISIASPSGREQVSTYLANRNMPVYRHRYDLWRQTPGWMCGATLSASDADPGRLVFGHVFIGSEVTGLLRKSCLHEEIVQSLGLTNDSDAARPSIFNDDQEFAVLTRHDEVLLRTLYDPRLEAGMTAEQAMPIVRRILSEFKLDEQTL